MAFIAPFNRGGQQNTPQQNPWAAAMNSQGGQAFSKAFAPPQQQINQSWQPTGDQIQTLMQNNAGAPAAMNPMVQPQLPSQGPDKQGQQTSVQTPGMPSGPSRIPFSPWKGGM